MSPQRLPCTPSRSKSSAILLVVFVLISWASPTLAQLHDIHGTQMRLKYEDGHHFAFASHPRDVENDNRDGGQQPLRPEYTPVVTPGPDQDAALASKGYRQITFYSCKTRDGSEQCGWHVPIMKAEGGVVRRNSGTVILAVVCLAGVFALGLM